MLTPERILTKEMRGNLEWRAKFGTTEYIYWNAYEHDAGLRLEMELAAWIVRFKLIEKTKSRHFDHVDENTITFAVSDNTVLISAFCLASWLFIFFSSYSISFALLQLLSICFLYWSCRTVPVRENIGSLCGQLIHQFHDCCYGSIWLLFRVDPILSVCCIFWR